MATKSPRTFLTSSLQFTWLHLPLWVNWCYPSGSLRTLCTTAATHIFTNSPWAAFPPRRGMWSWSWMWPWTWPGGWPSGGFRARPSRGACRGFGLWVGVGSIPTRRSLRRSAFGSWTASWGRIRSGAWSFWTSGAASSPPGAARAWSALGGSGFWPVKEKKNYLGYTKIYLNKLKC